MLQQAEQERLAVLQQQQQAEVGNRDAVLAVSGEEAFMRRARLSGRAPPQEAPPPPGPEGGGGLGLGAPGGFGAGGGGGGGGGMSAAQRMMEKMGWREGQGLGKARQGMTTPLVAQKTDTHAAVIVNAQPTPAPAPAPEKKVHGRHSTPKSCAPCLLLDPFLSANCSAPLVPLSLPVPIVFFPHVPPGYA